MKRVMLAPISVLALLLFFSLWNSTVISHETQRWQGQLTQSAQLAAQEQWADAAQALQESYQDWSRHQVYLHIVLEHDAVDDAEAMYRRAAAFAAQKEPSEFQAETADLYDQLRLLAEMEQFSLKNIL